MARGAAHTGYKSKNHTVADGDTSLAEELNIFFARFKAEQPHAATSHPSTCDNILMLEDHEVWCTLKGVNPRKAAGPDGIPGIVLKNCADQLAVVFTRIINQSLSQYTVPPCLKASVIVPLLKKTAVSSLNDYHPVALTLIITKCFEISSLPPALDSHQFAYRANRSTEDAIATALHPSLSHLEHQVRYARPFVDFSSVFNTILPHRLVPKLTALGLSSSICHWILDFLTNRSQRVRVGSHQGHKHCQEDH